MKTAPLALSLWMLLGLGSAQAAEVYTRDFEAGPLGAEWSGAGAIQSTAGLSAFGFGSQHLRNETSTATVLSLSGLAPHTSMTLSFSLAMWDSIDFGDAFQISADANILFNSPASAFGNYFTPGDQCAGPGTVLTPPFTAFSTPNHGYNDFFRDCARAVSFTFAHSLPTVSFSFLYGSQGGLDESFGLDNVIVSTDATGGPPPTGVPEPGSLALIALGLVGLAASRRRDRKI